MTKHFYSVIITFLISLYGIAQPGMNCANPIVIGSLPFSANDNTANYGNPLTANQGTLCSAAPSTTNYLAGNDVFYSFTPTETGTVSIVMTPTITSTNSSIFVYSGCENIGVTCITGFANPSVITRFVTLNAIANLTYTIVVSSAMATPTVSYNLAIQKDNCLPRPTGVTASEFTTSGATLSWENPGNFSSWQVEVQNLGDALPTGEGETVNTPFFVKTGLEPAMQYQFWVRAECTPGSGIFTAWVGPFPFGTLICQPATTCGYTFRLTDTGNNGWGTNRMQVKQNGIVVAALGSQITTGGGPVDIMVPLCPNVPFDLVSSATGASPQQCGVTILNSFNQTLYTKPNTIFSVGETFYSGTANCEAVDCSIAPTNVNATSVTFTEATIVWEAPATSSWDVYVVPSGAAAPDALTIPTYDNVTNNPLLLNSLIPDTSYDVYVRVNCAPSPSPWSAAGQFSTIATCFRPSNTSIQFSSITMTSATIAWSPGTPQDTAWEILLVPGDVAETPGVNPVIGNGTLFFEVSGQPSFNVTSLTPATIYNVFIRTVCSPADKSKWNPEAGGFKFNTVTCNQSDKCNYKFILTNTSTNSWNGARIQVRQNGILITTLGAALINNPNGVTVPLCNNVPFDLYWSVAGTFPESIGIKVLNPFGDLIYTKPPGVMAPGMSIYNTTGNCTPPSCPKPENVTAVNVTSSLVELGWTSPSPSLYDLYIVPYGAEAPQNEPSTIPTISGVSNPYTLTQINGQPLMPSTTYTYYVRKVCSPTDNSTWTINTPVTFTTKPVNDECIEAISLTVNVAQNCTVSGSGTTTGATASSPVLNPPLTGSYCGLSNKDIWYSFIATHSSHTVNLEVLEGISGFNYSVFSGECNNLTKLGCFNTLSSTVQNLIIGNKYYIRVYTPSVNTSTFVFTLCITSPPVNDECTNAISLSVNPAMIPSQVTNGNTLGASTSATTIEGTVCAGTDDDVWYKFSATSTTHIVNLKNTAGTTPLSNAVYKGDCALLTTVICSFQEQTVLNNLIPGAEYKIRVYTAGTTNGNWAEFEISVITPPAIENDECSTAITLTVNENSQCQVISASSIIGATASPQPSSCIGSKDDDVWYKFTAISPTHSIDLSDITGVNPNLNHAVYSGNCNGLSQLYCSAANSDWSVYKQYVAGQTYYLRIWSNSDVPQSNTFTICIKSVSTCQNATEFCGSSPDEPYVFPNTVGLSDNTQIACLGTTPNPVFYTLKVIESGALMYSISQYESFTVDGQPEGPGLDVDYAAWGPFPSAESCDLITLADCPTCPNNTVDPNFYPFGNIVDCSYSINEIETLSIPNAGAGEVYIVMITNFENDPGYIKLTQTNFLQPNAGATSCADKIQLIAFVDQNNNGVKDPGEVNFKHGNFIYQKNNTGPLSNVTSITGRYNIYDTNPANTYDFSFAVFSEFAPYYSVSPTSFNDLSIAENSGTLNLFFPVTVLTEYYDVAVSMVPLQPARAGFTHTNRIVYKNLGLTPVSGSLSFTHDPAVGISVSESVALNDNGFTYAFSNLQGYETRTLDVMVSVPGIPDVAIDDVLDFNVNITPPSGDINASNNTFTSSQIVVASYDPNDKMESHGGAIRINEFPIDGYFNYTIRFQNTGTYYASTVRIEDLLDAQLDETSIRIESASHPYSMERIGNKVIWNFESIDLPSIVQDEVASHGYINFRIKPKAGFAVGDMIPNTASIFFDSNPAIVTNTFQTTFEEQLSTPEFTNGNVIIYPNPARTKIEIITRNTAELIEGISLYDITGKVIKRSGKLSSVSTSLDVSDLAKGIYLIEITTGSNMKMVQKLIVN